MGWLLLDPEAMGAAMGWLLLLDPEAMVDSFADLRWERRGVRNRDP